MEKTNILFLSVGRRVELVKAFKDAMNSEGVIGDLVGVDFQENAPALYFTDKFSKICAITDVNYIDELIDLCREYQISLVIPTIDTELEILSRNKDRIEKASGSKIMVSSESIINIIRNKNNTYKFLIKNGFKTPRVIMDSDLKSKNYQFPLFVKPLDGSSSMNNFKVNNEEELNFFRKYVKNPIIQEFIDGIEYCVDVFNDFEGNVITIVPKLRVASRAGEIMKGTIVKDRNIIKLIQKLMKKLKACGEINVDCMIKGEEIYIIEINGRFAGGAPMSFKAGANSPVNLLKLLRGEKLAYNEDYEEEMVALRFDNCIYLNNKGELI